MISDNGCTFEAAAKKIELVFSSEEVEQHLERQGSMVTYVSAEDLEEPLIPSHPMYRRHKMNLPDHLLDDGEDNFDSQALTTK